MSEFRHVIRQQSSTGNTPAVLFFPWFIYTLPLLAKIDRQVSTPGWLVPSPREQISAERNWLATHFSPPFLPPFLSPPRFCVRVCMLFFSHAATIFLTFITTLRYHRYLDIPWNNCFHVYASVSLCATWTPDALSSSACCYLFFLYYFVSFFLLII